MLYHLMLQTDTTTKEEDVFRGVESIYIDDTDGGPEIINYQQVIHWHIY